MVEARLHVNIRWPGVCWMISRQLVEKIRPSSSVPGGPTSDTSLSGAYTMDRFPFRKRQWTTLGGSTNQPSGSRTVKKAALQLENLEGRVVLSQGGGFFGGLGNVGAEIAGFVGGYGNNGFNGGSTVLSQDALKVRQAYQTFNSTVQADVATLRQTATTTTVPTSAGLTAYNTAIASAVTTLNSSIASDVSNLTNTGAAVTSTIDAATANLQTELQSAATGLTNSSNASVLSLYRENATYLQGAYSQSAQAILNDAPTGVINGATRQTFNNSVSTAFQTFNSAINTAKQTAITGGKALDSTAVSSAVSALQTSLTSAQTALGTSYTSSAASPSSAISTALTSLTAQLTSITAPTAGNTSSTRNFAFNVNSAVYRSNVQVYQLLTNSITQYNQNLL